MVADRDRRARVRVLPDHLDQTRPQRQSPRPDRVRGSRRRRRNRPARWPGRPADDREPAAAHVQDGLERRGPPPAVFPLGRVRCGRRRDDRRARDTSRSWAAPTTCSTSPRTGSRPPTSRARSSRIRLAAKPGSAASPTRSKAKRSSPTSSCAAATKHSDDLAARSSRTSARNSARSPRRRRSASRRNSRRRAAARSCAACSKRKKRAKTSAT